MTNNARPTDAELQRMGILRVDTMLPPSPEMLAAGSRHFAPAPRDAKYFTVLLERIFTTMVLEEMKDLERLGATVRAEGAQKPAPLAQTVPTSTPPSAAVQPCQCEFCIKVRKSQNSAIGPGATAEVRLTNAPALVKASKGILGMGATVRRGSGATVPPIPPGIQESNPVHLRIQPTQSAQSILRDFFKKGGAQ